MAKLIHCALYPCHIKSGARMKSFAGFSVPFSYAGPQVEHLAVRQQAGLFDISHEGNILVTGAGSMALLQKLLVTNVTKLLPLDTQYTAMCNKAGGIIDDIIVTYLEPKAYHIVTNPQNTAKVYKWLTANIKGDVQVKDQSQELCVLAIQGPAAISIAQKVIKQDLSALEFGKAGYSEVDGTYMVYARMGFTGEDGLEFYPKNGDAASLWERLIKTGKKSGLVLAGMSARNSLRIEAGDPAYGQELSEDISILSTPLSELVDMEKGEFIGREAIKQNKKGWKTTLMGLESEGSRPLPTSARVLYNGKGVGNITSSCVSPTLKKSIGMAILDGALVSLGSEVQINNGSRVISAKVVDRTLWLQDR